MTLIAFSPRYTAMCDISHATDERAIIDYYYLWNGGIMAVVNVTLSGLAAPSAHSPMYVHNISLCLYFLRVYNLSRGKPWQIRVANLNFIRKSMEN